MKAVLFLINEDGYIKPVKFHKLAPSGVNKGCIVDGNLLMLSISNLISYVTQQLQADIDEVIVVVPNYGVNTLTTIGECDHTVTDDAPAITGEDIRKAMTRCKLNIQSIENTIIHLLPRQFMVDKHPVEDPKGIIGKTLELDAVALTMRKDQLVKISDVFKTLNYRISGYMTDTIATSDYLDVISNSDHNIFIDIGGWYSKITIKSHDTILNTFIVPLGGQFITKDISECLNITITEAERLKIVYGDVILDRIDESFEILLNHTSHGKFAIKKLLLNQIIVERLNEMILIIKNYCDDYLLSGFNVTFFGGVTKTTGFEHFVKTKFKHDNINLLSTNHVLEDPDYVVAVGSIKYAISKGAIQFPKSRFVKLFETVRKIKEKF